MDSVDLNLVLSPWTRGLRTKLTRNTWATQGDIFQCQFYKLRRFDEFENNVLLVVKSIVRAYLLGVGVEAAVLSPSSVRVCVLTHTWIYMYGLSAHICAYWYLYIFMILDAIDALRTFTKMYRKQARISAHVWERKRDSIDMRER